MFERNDIQCDILREKQTEESRETKKGTKRGQQFHKRSVIDDDIRELIYSYNIYLFTLISMHTFLFFFHFALKALKRVESSLYISRSLPYIISQFPLCSAIDANWCWSSNRSCWLYSNTSLPCKLHFIRATKKNTIKSFFFSCRSYFYCISIERVAKCGKKKSPFILFII